MDGYMLFWLVVFVVAGYLCKWFVGRYSDVERFCILLKCSKGQAIDAKGYLEAERIEWLTFLEWTQGAVNTYMPMFGDASGTQLIATWDESKRAVLALVLKKKLDRSWGLDEAIAAIGREILIQRGLESQLVGNSQKHVIDTMTFS